MQELRFGDNDTLSAQVATLVQADWLFLMTDVDCLYTANPKVCACWVTMSLTQLCRNNFPQKFQAQGALGWYQLHVAVYGTVKK
jgi:glutamate 5-kinase